MNYTFADYGSGLLGQTISTQREEKSSVPVPAAAWLFISGLVGMIGVARRKRKEQ